jgi:hypothetical protein
LEGAGLTRVAGDVWRRMCKGLKMELPRELRVTVPLVDRESGFLVSNFVRDYFALQRHVPDWVVSYYCSHLRVVCGKLPTRFSILSNQTWCNSKGSESFCGDWYGRFNAALSPVATCVCHRFAGVAGAKEFAGHWAVNSVHSLIAGCEESVLGRVGLNPGSVAGVVARSFSSQLKGMHKLLDRKEAFTYLLGRVKSVKGWNRGSTVRDVKAVRQELGIGSAGSGLVCTALDKALYGVALVCPAMHSYQTGLEFIHHPERYRFLRCFSKAADAQGYVLDTLKSKIQRWSLASHTRFRFTRLVSARAPTGYIMQKPKAFSTPAFTVSKYRAVISYYKAPTSALGRRVARGLSFLLASLYSACDGHIGCFSIDGCAKKLHSIPVPCEMSESLQLVEMDLDCMFLNVDRSALPGLIDQFFALVKGCHPRRRFLAVHKAAGGVSQWGCGDPSVFWNMYIEELRYYCHYVVEAEDVFCVGGCVFQQINGVPIGHQISAQLSEIWCFMRERAVYQSFCSLPMHLLCRYRDNVLAVVPTDYDVSNLCISLGKVYGMGMKVECAGKCITSLGLDLSIHTGGIHMSAHCKGFNVADQSYGHGSRRLPTRSSIVYKRAIRSYCCSTASRVARYACCEGCLRMSLNIHVQELLREGHPLDVIRWFILQTGKKSNIFT